MSYSGGVNARTEFRRGAAGQRCLALIVQSYWYAGELVEDANVLYIQVADTEWLRIFFDGGEFFCAVEPELTLPEFAEDDMKVTGADFGAQHKLVGRRIEDVEFLEFPEGGELRIDFEGGATVVLRNADDQSTVSIKTAVA